MTNGSRTAFATRAVARPGAGRRTSRPATAAAALFALALLVLAQSPARADEPFMPADEPFAPVSGPAVAADGVTTAAASPGTTTPAITEPAGLGMAARALLQGHARPGAWMAIAVDLSNDGPPLTGELRMTGGTQGTTRFSVPVDLPTTSRKSYSMYVQAPVFGSKVDVSLVRDSTVVAKRQVAFALHDVSQLSVGVIAERSGDLVASLGRVNDPTAVRPAIFGLTPADLPARTEAWAPIDRLVWQDVDTTQLTREQLAALRTWVAGGGRLTIVGGTAGAGILGALPDELLPYRPATTLDVDPLQIRALVGGTLPADATPVAALAGTLRAGRAMATSGDQAIVAEMPYGSGGVAIVGFDPTGSWLGGTDRADAVWQRVVPGRAGATGQILVGDDSPFLSLLQMIPSLALPSIEGLLLLLLGYIILVGPVNYLVLRRLDRREWAWVSIPLIVAGSTLAAFAIGNSLRGSDVIVNQVAVVRGAPGTDAAQAQVFLGIFSPSRSAYDLSVGTGALVTAPISDISGTGTSGNLDVVQAEPATVRGLTVAYGSMRTVRADASVTAPTVTVSLVTRDGRLVGSVRNDSPATLSGAAITLGMTVARLGDLAPGATVAVDEPIRTGQMGSSLSERLFGPGVGFDSMTREVVRDQVRRQLIDALTYDPFQGWTGTLPTPGPVLLAWGQPGVLDIRVRGSAPVMTGETLYYVPLEFGMEGRTAFGPDLIRVSIVDNKAQMFQKDPTYIGMGVGTVVLAYRPVSISGTLTQQRLVLAVNSGDPFNIGEPTTRIKADPPAQPAASPSASPALTASPAPSPAPPDILPAEPTSGPGTGTDPAAPPPQTEPAPRPAPIGQSGMPGVELFDLRLGAWRGLSQLPQSGTVEIEEADHFVDPDSGTVLVRFSSQDPNATGLQFSIRIEGMIQ